MSFKVLTKLTIAAFCCTWGLTSAQVYVSKSSTVHFFSETPMENIEATSKEATSVLNSQTGELLITIGITSFKFPSKLMEEHFNENYMETEKYPKSEFKGKIVDLKAVDFKKDGVYNVVVEGDLTVHGVKKAKKINAKLEVKGGQVTGTSKFVINLEEFKIERPKIVWEKIAENIDVDVNFVYAPYVKK